MVKTAEPQKRESRKHSY